MSKLMLRDIKPIYTEQFKMKKEKYILTKLYQLEKINCFYFHSNN